MKNVLGRIGILLAIVAAIGCAGPATNAQPKAEDKPELPASTNSLGIPEELATDGLKLLGYPFEKQIEYKVSGFPTAGQSSTQKIVPGFEKGKNVLTLSYQGETNMPSESYELRADGVYGVALGGNDLKPPMKALSATIAIGDSWPNKGAIDQGGVTLDLVVKIVGRQKVKVAAGEFDAIVLSETGTIAASGKRMSVVGKGWYVAGIGAVKRTVAQTDSAGKTSNITIEAVSIK